MTTAHRPLSTLGRSRLLMTAVLTAMVASLTVGLPGSAGAVGHLVIGFVDDTPSVTEEDDGTVTIVLDVRAYQETAPETAVPPEQDINFDWETQPDPDDGSNNPATPDEDYVPASGSDTIAGIDNGGTDGETTITLDNINGDTEIEEHETFLVKLTSDDATVDNDTATVTIENDDPKVSIADAEVPEGEAPELTVSLTAPVPADGDPVSVDWSTSTEDGDDAAAGDDYMAESGTATIEPGEQTTTILTSETAQDAEAESDETFTVTLTDPTNAFAGDMTATVTIIDDEPRVWISDVTQPEGHSGVTDFVFEVHVDPTIDEEVVVNYETVDGDGDDGATAKTDPDTDHDYLPESDQLTFSPGSADPQTVTVKVDGDTDGEPDETFTVDLDWPNPETAPNVSLDVPGEGTIENDDDPTVNVLAAEAEEGADGETPSLAFLVELVDEEGNPQPAGADITLEYSTTADTATEDEDYQHIDNGSPASTTIPAGESEGTLPVTIVGDDVAEDDEVFTVDIGEPDENTNPDLTPGSMSAVGTIVDDDGRPTITIGDVEKAEQDGNFHFMEFPVRLSHPSAFEVTVDFNTDDGTAQDEDADGDYKSTTGTLTFEPGDVERIIPVKIFGDEEPEASETLLVQLTAEVNARFPDDAEQIEATGTIINDDGPEVSIGDAQVTEGDSGTVEAVLELTTPAAEHDGFSVDYSTVDGTAVAGSDYAATSGTVTFDQNVTATTVTVPVHGDTEDETDETFTVELSGPDFASIADGQGTVTIVDDDDSDGDDGGADDGTDDTGGDDGGGTADDGPDVAEVSRSAGDDRVATALAVAADHWSATATASGGDVNAPEGPHAVLATAATFPDALAGGALAALLDAPLLLTYPDDLDPRVLDELARRDVRRVWVLGGHAAISPQIEAELTEAGYEVVRYAGSDRFETAAQVARGVGASLNGEIVVALGSHADPNRAWPDALAAGALTAAPDPPPVLLTAGDRLPAVTAQALTDLQASKVFLMGGTAAVSSQVEQQLVDLGLAVERVAGTDRYGTSVAAAKTALDRHPTGDLPVVFATGNNFPDGLAAGALAAHLEGLLLLVPHGDLPEGIATFLTDNAFRLDEGTVVGGDVAISESVREAAEDAMRAG